MGTSGRKKRAGAGWRKRFLGAMARTANAKLSARMAGVDFTTAYQLRKRDAGFAAAWVRARDWGRARVEAEGRAVFACGRPRRARPAEMAEIGELRVCHNKREGSQKVRVGDGRWTQEAEDSFLEWLAAGHGIRRSAERAGFSYNAVWARRRLHADFAERWDQAKAQGSERNDFLLLDSVQWTLDPEAVEAAEQLPRPTIAEAIRIQRMFRAGGQSGGGGGPHRRRGRGPPEKTFEQSMKSILDKIEAIERHEEPEKLAAGWTRDKAGNWIPPGWVRKAS